MLGVSPNTLRTWERRFGYPAPRRTAGGHRLYDLAEIEALRSAFAETGNVSSAIALARERGAGPATRRRGCAPRSTASTPTEADRVLEESLATRSVERTVEEVLLPAVEAPERRPCRRRAGLRLALGHRAGWPPRHASGPARDAPRGRVVFEASRALRPRRAARPGARARAAPPRAADPGAALRASTPDASRARIAAPSRPDAVVLTGRRASLDALGRLVFAARRVGGDRVARPRLPRRARPRRARAPSARLDGRAAGAAERAAGAPRRAPAAAPARGRARRRWPPARACDRQPSGARGDHPPR